MHLVRISWMPATSTTARTAPPAITPVPSDAGLSKTSPAPNRPSASCGIEPLMRGILNRFFFACSGQPLRHAARRDHGGDLLRARRVPEASQSALDLLVEISHRDERLVRDVVHHLHVDVLERTKHAHARALGRAMDALPDAEFAL